MDDNDFAVLNYIKHHPEDLLLIEAEWENGRPVIVLASTADMTTGSKAVIPLAVIITDKPDSIFANIRPPHGANVNPRLGTFDPNSKTVRPHD